MYMFGCELLNIRKLQSYCAHLSYRHVPQNGIVSAEDMGKNAGLEKIFKDQWII